MEDLFEKYWRGTLSEAERQAFGERLHTEPETETAYRSFVLAAEASRRLAEIELKSIMIKPEAAEAKSRSISLWKIAAVLIPLGVLGFFFFFGTDSQELFAESFLMPSTVVTRSDLDSQSTFTKLLNAEDCQAALAFVDGLDDDRKTNYYRYYEGICLLKTGDLKNAEIIFHTLIQSQDSRFLADAEWYSLLTAVKSNNREVAQDRCETILSDENHPHREQARKIKRKISSPFYNLW